MLTLTIPSDLNLVALVRGCIQTLCQTGGVDEDTTDAVVLAANEATNNVIRHGHQNRIEATIRLECQLTAERLEIAILDEGIPFDVTAVPELDPTELRPGGRGVFLMRAIMDELSTIPRSGGGNILRMVKRFSTPAAAPVCSAKA